MKFITKLLIICLIFVLSWVKSQSVQMPQDGGSQESERESGEVIEIGKEPHALRRYVLDHNMNPRNHPVIVVFTHLHSNESHAAATQIAKLAALTDDKPVVVRADCLFDVEACDLFKNHLVEYNKTFPLLVMLTNK